MPTKWKDAEIPESYNEWMIIYNAHKKFPHKNTHVHIAGGGGE